MPGPNPLEDPLRFERRVPPCSVVIFGASGDLTKRKLIPSLYRLAYERRLPAGFAIVGTSRTEMSDDDFRGKMRESTVQFLEDSPFNEDLWADFAKGIFYLAGDLKDPALYQRISDKLATIATERQTGPNVLFYLSTQPAYYAPVIEQLGAAGLSKETTPDMWRRVVIEKPFGTDGETARALNDVAHRSFTEEQIYRIDHYLGKETVQNILAFRFGNGIFEPLWNRQYIDHVQITAAESIGVEGRGDYYETSGALRDMIQNHLLQVMATVAMEPPAVFEPTPVRDERAKLLRSIRIVKPNEVSGIAVPGQYTGYRGEKGVDPNSTINTYAAATFYVDNWRWAGVPFYIRSGKKLARRVTDIAIQFHRAPHRVFNHSAGDDAEPTLLVLRVQPEEGISMRFLSKRPGSGMSLRPVSMDFKYGASFGLRSPTAYETLLVDALTGDATLYTRQDMVEASWRVVEPILNVWSEAKTIPAYEQGSWGPPESDEMLARTGREWRTP
jgi:glucose-6-phosphate 1-dehydrogenase